MLKGILDERDEKQRSDLELRVLALQASRAGANRLQLTVDYRFVVATQFHQRDIIAHEVHLTLNGHCFFVRLVHGIAQQVTQLGDGILGSIGVDLRQTGDIIQRIEEEVRINLVLQPR